MKQRGSYVSRIVVPQGGDGAEVAHLGPQAEFAEMQDWKVQCCEFPRERLRPSVGLHKDRLAPDRDPGGRRRADGASETDGFRPDAGRLV